MGNKRCNNFVGVIIIFIIWIPLSFVLTKWIVSKVTPSDVLLGEYSCSYATNSECAEKKTKPRAEQEIQANLQQVVGDVEKISIIFQLPLKVLQFNLVLKEKGSEVQSRISEPKSSNTLLKGLDLKCVWGETPYFLSAYGRTELNKSPVRLNSVAEESSRIKIAKDIMGDFKGCDWSPQKNIELKDTTRRVVAPNASVSIELVLKPYMTFKAQRIGMFFIFIAWFAIIGGLIALLKEVIQILKKGTNYFIE